MGAHVEVILLETVENVGRAGDIVRVKAGFARNYLIPRHYAVPATESNKKRFEAKMRALRLREAQRLADAQELAKLIEATAIVIAANAGESGRLFGSVTANDIADVLATKGITVDRRRIQMEENIRQLGVFEIPIRLHPEVIAKVRVEVIPNQPEYVQAPAEPESSA
ncbi:MAG: 50S ribosomal protein L9 [Candidatus Poribacteria bacterium]|nr:MAG: 50S ribosomal protein L9 [Candidatus Poribacteria bacterium]